MASSANLRSGRSPRFPGYPIRDAIVYAEKIYRAVHRSPVDAQTAFRLMGFAGKSGASATALGAIRQYGLIEGVGDNTRISDLALRILEPVSSAERQEAVLEAAKKPDVFRAILERFDGRVPPADEPVRAFLIRDLGFSKRGVEECLAALRATLDVIGEIGGTNEGASLAPSELEAAPRHQVEPLTAAESGDQSEFLRIPLTRACSVELRFVGPVTEKAIANLIRHIELTKEVWADE